MDPDTNTALGLALVLLSTVCNGTFALPPKFVRNWAWENTWGAFFFLTLLVLPAAVVFTTVNGTVEMWRESPPEGLVYAIVFGFLWGCGIIGFGIGVTAVGLSLGFSIIISLSALLGSMVPLVTQHPEEVFTPGGLVITLGVLICVAGIAACGRAGVLRERGQSVTASGRRPASGALLNGLLICVVAGLCSSGSNIGFSWAKAIIVDREGAPLFGNPPWLATMPVWMLVFCGAFVACGAYSTWRLFRNSTWGNFANQDAGRNLLLAGAMAVLHFATLFSYGVGAHYLGKLGTSVGYALMMSCSLVVANAMGFMTGEWRGTSGRTRQWVYGGLSLLVAGILALTVGNNMR